MSCAAYEERPRSVSQGEYRDDRYLLTHAFWHGSPTYSPQPETGVRTLENGVVQADSFRLLQHGCFDFKLAETVIVAGLNKGWDTDRICTLIEWLAPRRRRKARLA